MMLMELGLGCMAVCFLKSEYLSVNFNKKNKSAFLLSCMIWKLQFSVFVVYSVKCLQVEMLQMINQSTLWHFPSLLAQVLGRAIHHLSVLSDVRESSPNWDSSTLWPNRDVSSQSIFTHDFSFIIFGTKHFI